MKYHQNFFCVCENGKYGFADHFNILYENYFDGISYHGISYRGIHHRKKNHKNVKKNSHFSFSHTQKFDGISYHKKKRESGQFLDFKS